MFIKTSDGRLVNLNLVGEIAVERSFNNSYVVRAFTGAGDDDNPAVYVHISGHETREAAEEALGLLYNWLHDRGFAL